MTDQDTLSKHIEAEIQSRKKSDLHARLSREAFKKIYGFEVSRGYSHMLDHRNELFDVLQMILPIAKGESPADSYCFALADAIINEVESNPFPPIPKEQK